METTISVSRHPKFVRWALMLGIVVILNVFFSVLVSLTLPVPAYNDFCPAQSMVSPADAATCDAQGGIWTEYPTTPVPAGVTKPVTNGYCDMYAKCQQPYQVATDRHALYAFVFWIVLGVAALFVGLLPLGSAIVSTGLSYGGVLALVIGSASYWGTAGNWLRLLIAAVGLAALVYLGVRKFAD